MVVIMDACAEAKPRSTISRVQLCPSLSAGPLLAASSSSDNARPPLRPGRLIERLWQDAPPCDRPC